MRIIVDSLFEIIIYSILSEHILYEYVGKYVQYVITSFMSNKTFTYLKRYTCVKS